MKIAIESSLLLALATGLAYLFMPNIRKWAGYVFLAFLTAFVAISLITVQQRLSSEVKPIGLELDQSELSLKMLSAFRATQNKESTDQLKAAISGVQYDGAGLSQMLANKISMQVVVALEKRLPPKKKVIGHAQLEDTDLCTLSEIAIVCGDSEDATLHNKLVGAVEVLSWSNKPQFKDLGTAISSIYSDKAVSLSDAGRFEKLLNDNTSGWYRDHALERLFKVSGQTAKYQNQKAENENTALVYAQRIISLLLVMSFATLLGIIVILIFLATEPRKVEPAKNLAPWPLTVTYGVLVGWLATQLIAQSLIATFAKQQVKQLLHAGSTTTALATLVIYLITTGPALLYVWWFACRPAHISFVDAVCLKFKTAVAGTPKLLIYGVLTWCAALPMVLGSQLLSFRLFSQHGSNNPMLSLVRDAAHAPSFLTVAIYFFVLAGVAPLAEESLFRGFVYTSLRRRWGKYISAVISGAAFAGMHFDPGGFVALLVLGFLFALVRERYQSIVPSMVAHGIWNGGTFLVVLLLLGGS